MRLEHRLDFGADRHLLPGIAQKVAEHAHAAGVRQFDQHDDVGPVALERRVHRMPGPFPAVDAAATGDFGKSLQLADDGIRLVETNGDLINMPELLRVKGAVLAAMPEPRVEEAEANLMHSLELSRRQGARASELRTAIDLARLMAGQGRREDARDLLERVFAGFSEGQDTADLKRAEQLLAMLG